MTQAQISAGPTQSNRSGPVTRVLAGILRRFAEIGAATQHLSRPKHPAVAQGHGPNANGAAEPTAGLTPDAIDKQPEIKVIAPFVPGQEEIERRRDVVRTFFNGFWNGASDKPAAFVKRLDEAEDYLNERLAANGESWRLDAKTRAMLGLPPRSNA